MQNEYQRREVRGEGVQKQENGIKINMQAQLSNFGPAKQNALHCHPSIDVIYGTEPGWRCVSSLPAPLLHSSRAEFSAESFEGVKYSCLSHVGDETYLTCAPAVLSWTTCYLLTGHMTCSVNVDFSLFSVKRVALALSSSSESGKWNTKQMLL